VKITTDMATDDERALREQPEFARLIDHLEAAPRSTAPRCPRRPLPQIPQPTPDRRRPTVICTRPSLWQRLLDWLAGERP
jgi:hypothetical protein